MRAKNIIRLVLLAIVALAVGGWAVKEFGGNKPASATTGEETRADGVTVINFHGEKRCRSCIRIGTLAQQTLGRHFAGALQSGEVRWEHINYEAAENTRYVARYGLVSSTIVATRWKDGKETAWTRLDGVWDHLDDESAFDAYLAKGIRELRDKP